MLSWCRPKKSVDTDERQLRESRYETHCMCSGCQKKHSDSGKVSKSSLEALIPLNKQEHKHSLN